MRRIWWWRKNPIENEINLVNRLIYGNTHSQNMKDMNISKNHKNKLQFVHFSQLITIINFLSYSIHILDINNTFIIRIHLQTESENTSKTKPINQSFSSSNFQFYIHYDPFEQWLSNQFLSLNTILILICWFVSLLKFSNFIRP